MNMAYPGDFWGDWGCKFNINKDTGNLIMTQNGITTEENWYKNSDTDRPWIPKWKNFKSLVKQLQREDDLGKPPKKGK